MKKIHDQVGGIVRLVPLFERGEGNYSSLPYPRYPTTVLNLNSGAAQGWQGGRGRKG